MAETIYTIPINEAFEFAEKSESPICPFCKLESDLVNNEIDIISGASMMEPDIRIKTNKSGFCPTHFSHLMAHGKRLPLALMLESHLNEIYGEVTKKDTAKSFDKVQKRLNALNSSCYICERVESNYRKILSNAVYMWSKDEEFRDRLKAQKCLCIKHFNDFSTVAQNELSKKQFPDFYESASGVFASYFKELAADVSWFCKKFDYRYENEPWYNAKDSVERAVDFLSCKQHKD